MVDRKWLFVVFGILGIVAYAGAQDRGFQVTNEKLERDYAPIRLVTKPLGKDSNITTAEWAGTAGVSITSRSPQVRADVFRVLKERCGFEQEQLLETRIVSHKAPLFYEVWVFSDPLSGQKDKQSGVSVVMKQLPNGGGVDFKLSGECHSKEPPVFISTR